RTCGDSGMVQLVLFAVTIGGDKTLLVWELSSGPTAEALQFCVLYSVRVFPNAAVGGLGFYAIIKFYSGRDAHRAQKACNQKQLFHTSPEKPHNRLLLGLLGCFRHHFHHRRVIIIPYGKEGNPEACYSESYDRCIQKLLIVVLGKTFLIVLEVLQFQ
ncbi:hypothetical protein EI555_002471, partial [Monodon monoceros]